MPLIAPRCERWGVAPEPSSSSRYSRDVPPRPAVLFDSDSRHITIVPSLRPAIRMSHSFAAFSSGLTREGASRVEAPRSREGNVVRQCHALTQT